MSLRAIAWGWVWTAALLLVAGLALGDRAAIVPPTFNGAEIAVIGSSQTKYAFAKGGDGGQGDAAGSLLGDGRSHYRIGLPAISEPEALLLVDRAVAERAELVLLEVWPLVYDVAQFRAARSCDQPARTLRIWLKQRQRDYTDALAHLIGRATSTDDGGEPPDINSRDLQAFASSARNFALFPRVMCDTEQLEQEVRAAKAGGTQIILVAPPRSVTAERRLGPSQVEALDNAARLLARRLDVPMFAPAGPWPDNRFVSIGHLNSAGRAQMNAELRAWIGRQP